MAAMFGTIEVRRSVHTTLKWNKMAVMCLLITRLVVRVPHGAPDKSSPPGIGRLLLWLKYFLEKGCLLAFGMKDFPVIMSNFAARLKIVFIL
jgi:hypothetical protein